MTIRTTPSVLTKRWPWIALALVAASMEAFALYCQHVLGMEPCNECIYVRSGVAGLFVTGLLGAIVPRIFAVRAILLAGAGAALGFALQHAKTLVDIEHKVAAGEIAGCARFHGFPSWMDLQRWIPEMFEPRGKCGEILGTFLGQSFAVWSLVGLSVLATIAAIVLIRDFIRP